MNHRAAAMSEAPDHPQDDPPAEPRPADAPSGRLPDVLASVVVFLVALPLCIGIAVACGVPAERGLVTGIIGGLIVGVFSGAPLLVSGPAASLIVPVFDLVRVHGLVALAPVVILAGAWQGIAGVLRLGQWFRAVAPAVIQGMLVGIGILIFASQLHVAIDADPGASFVANVVAFPGELSDRLTGRGDRGGPASVLVAVATIALLVGWNRFRSGRLKLVPGHLIALVVVTLVTALVKPRVGYLDVSPSFFAGLEPVALGDFSVLRDPQMIAMSLVFAFVASAATLLTATAIDQRQSHSQADYDREMLAQGVGNVLTGALGGLPMTGVIVRSSVNVDAGARTRLSTILHGLWILAFVSLAPELLELIPRASLGAILVYTGYKLIDVGALVTLHRQGRAELGIALITLLGVVFVDLFAGIVAGLVAAFGKLVYTFARLEVTSEASPSEAVQHLYLTGSATFLQLPRLAKILDAVPRDRGLHVHLDRLDHIDHACLELLSNWNRRRENEGVPGMIVQWDELTNRYRNALVGAGPRAAGPAPSLVSLVWTEWKRIYAPRYQGPEAPGQPSAAHDWQQWIDASRVRVRVPAATLDDVLSSAAELLAPGAALPTEEVASLLRDRVAGHVALGQGVSIPHAPIAGLQRSIAALVTTAAPVDVAGEPADVFFVLLAPGEDPRQHLLSLAHVGRLCHDAVLLAGLRNAHSPEEAARLLGAAAESLEDGGSAARDRGHALAILEIGDRAHVERISQVVDEALGHPVLLSLGAFPFKALCTVLQVPTSRYLLVLPIVERDEALLRTLLDEESRVFPDELCRLHVLRRDLEMPDRTRGKPA